MEGVVSLSLGASPYRGPTGASGCEVLIAFVDVVFVVADYRDRLLRSPDSLKSATAKPSLSPPPAPARPNSAGSNNSGSHLLLARPARSCCVQTQSLFVAVEQNSPRSSHSGRSPSPPLSVDAAASRASTCSQQLPPACGARQLSKLKRFLTTLIQFGSDVSAQIGERVRDLVLAVVVSQLSFPL